MCEAKLMEKKRTEKPDGDVRIKGNSSSDCKGELSEIYTQLQWSICCTNRSK